MSQHYTRNTSGVLKYCNRCGKNTMHKVSGKRIGLCENNHSKDPQKTPATVTPDNQGNLF